MALHHHFKKSRAAAAATLFCGAAALAQTLPVVSVSGRAADAPVQLGGFGDTPIAKLPMQATLLSADLLKDLGVNELSGLTSIDASISDSYNAEGYVSYLKIRGFDLDNRFNYLRDGLPINAEAALPLGDKSSIEVLKGTSGIQAGTSAPGGMVNMIVKRPTSTDFTTVGLSYEQSGTVETTLDWNHRLSADVGLRVNASAAHLDPQLYDAKGNRSLLAVAADWKASPGTLIEAEFELSHQSEPDQPGFSMLGDVVPNPRNIDPRINLNNQNWSLPTVFDGQTASLRITQELNADWRAQAHLGVQHLVNDDHLAFPFGCTANGADYTDRYCPNGDFDLYDFRSDNEHRNTSALDLSLTGKVSVIGMQHELSTGLLFTRFKARFGDEVYTYAGTGNISGQVQVPDSVEPYAGNANRDERSAEFYLRDAIRLSTDWQAWLGLRSTHLHRESVLTDGTQFTGYSQSFTTPWVGLSYALTRQLMAYTSWGQGVQSNVVSNLPMYTNAGQALPAQKSSQFELGLKAGTNTVDWSVNYFEIKQPVWRDIGACDGSDDSCMTMRDGYARHRGLEAQADFKWTGGGVVASAMKLHAREEGSVDTSLNGAQPVNTPATTLKLQARQNVAAGLQLQGGLVYEGRRAVLPDNSVFIPSWTRLDAGARLDQNWGRQMLTWRVGVENLADRRAWREAPYQYDHVYLYPLAPRTLRASLEIQI